jgi:3-oxoadipate enol-lactonase/4-carboxymuconolactone decarboxylase
VLTESFAADHPARLAQARETLAAMDPRGYAGCAAAIRDMALAGRLAQIAAPALVIAGLADTATPFAGHGDRIAAAIPAAECVLLSTGHWACVEEPGAFADAIRDFVGRCRPSMTTQPS